MNKEIKKYLVSELKFRGFSISDIARELRISRPTVYKYLDENLQDAVDKSHKRTQKKLLHWFGK